MKFEIRKFFKPAVLQKTSVSVHGIGVNEEMVAGDFVWERKTNDYLLMYFHTPTLAGFNAEKCQPIQDSLYIWCPNDYQFYGNEERNYLHSWVHLKGGFIDRKLKQLSLPTRTPMSSPKAKQIFLSFLRELYRECSELNPSPVVIQHLLEIFLIRLKREQTLLRDEINPIAIKARSLLLENIKKQWTLPLLASEVGLSVSHLSFVFGKAFHLSPMRFLMEERMQEALLLLNHRKSFLVGEVAHEVGFEDVYHFSKAFKAFHGKSPSELRS